jgi:hypothetical protein
VRILENTFSWSSSRASTFGRCLRAYWWQYYGAWGGWESDAPAEAREAYLLKNLSTRWAWVGTVVHSVIEHLLKRLHRRALGGQLRFEKEAVDVAHEIEETTRLMRLHFRESKRGEYRASPKRRFGLAEHEYGEPVSDEEWRGFHDKAVQAVEGFLRSEVFAKIRASDPATWLPIEALDKFQLEGTDVWAAPDFGLRLPDGGGEIYDWKTGAVAPEANRLQLACYTLYAEARHGIDPERVRSHLVYLGPSVEVHDFTLTRAELDEARRTIRASMDAMRARLADPNANRADREDFPMTEDRGRCAVCVFRRLCGR